MMFVQNKITAKDVRNYFFYPHNLYVYHLKEKEN